MTKLTEQLLAYGLSEKETHVYLAALSLGAASVARIAQRANEKRPTTYLVLEDLMRKNLVANKISEYSNGYEYLKEAEVQYYEHKEEAFRMVYRFCAWMTVGEYLSNSGEAPPFKADQQQINLFRNLVFDLALSINFYVRALKPQMARNRELINFLKKEYELD